MPCREYERRLSALEDYLDGRMDSSAAMELEAHLGSCAECREALEEARAASTLLRAVAEPVAEPGLGFWTRVMAGVRAEEERRRAGGDFWSALEAWAWRLSWSAMLTLALLTAFLLGSHFPGGAEPPSAQSEVRELFQEPMQQPANNEEVLLTLAENGKGR